MQRGKKGNLPREIAMYIARNKSSLSNTKLGEYFGGISGAGVTMRCKHFEEKLQRNKKLGGQVKKLIKSLPNN